MQFSPEKLILIGLFSLLVACGPTPVPYVNVGERDITQKDNGLQIYFESAGISNNFINLNFILEYAPTDEMRIRVNPTFDDRFDEIESVSVQLFLLKYDWVDRCNCYEGVNYHPIFTSVDGVNMTINKDQPTDSNKITLSQQEGNKLEIKIPLEIIGNLDPSGLGGSSYTIGAQLSHQQRQFALNLDEFSFTMFLFPNS